MSTKFTWLIVLAIGLIYPGYQLSAATYSNTPTPISWIDETRHIKLGPTKGGIYSPLYSFINNAGCGTVPPVIDDSITSAIPLGFTFTYGDKSFTSARIMSNGRLQFNNTTCGFGSPVTQLPYPDVGLNYTMRIYGNDLDPTSSQEVKGYDTSCNSPNRSSCFISYASLGSAPNRRFVVTWNKVPEWTAASKASGEYNLQLILQENGEFIYQYGLSKPAATSEPAQIGWQINSTDYDVISTQFPVNNSAIKFFIPKPVVIPTRFNAIEVSGNAFTSPIKTKIAGDSFSLDLTALDDATSSILTTFIGDVSLELVNSEAGTCANHKVIGTPQVINFTEPDQGKKRISITELNAWRQVKLRIKYPASKPTMTVCSADAFAIRPATFSLSITDQDWVTSGNTRKLNSGTASADPTHKAGQPFSIQATAYNSKGSVTTGYSGMPLLKISRCILPTVDCKLGQLSTGIITAKQGTLSSNTATYSEAGVIEAVLIDDSFAEIDASDGSSTDERTISSAKITVGRFVPDHFTVSANSPAFKPACNRFSYIGQPFGFGTAPKLTVTAKNSTGDTTLNYDGVLWRIPANGETLGEPIWTASQGEVSVVSTLPPPSITQTARGTGAISISVGDPEKNQGLKFIRNSPVEPFDGQLTFSVDIKDSDNVAYTDNPFVLKKIGFDDSDISTNHDSQLRFGRLGLSNAHGSERLTLPVGMTVQFYSDANFSVTTDDQCSTAELTITGQKDGSLSPQDTCIWDSTKTSGNFYCSVSGQAATNFGEADQLVNGLFNLHLKAPEKTGSLDLTAEVADWLKFSWQGKENENPKARVTFGIFKGDSQQIYFQEIY
ncbi:MAG: hypothetical protein Q7U98_13555 [Methylicorpusculum sp.]|uniref:DUF6701 domain-containing protein n=1 Tax=Methylicorpusculum sp. TaxID=2713644 RepID=UPI002728A17A|nr:DUF6701 domain-containing protein [Methylicorpusculum sp.]MDO8940173.1 hypothetical protein [Methylicorpusculum sp.]MDP2202210.1 hypothetical protein [Methylicorpusculum sp.]